jgi:uncharacterized membrane protein
LQREIPENRRRIAMGSQTDQAQGVTKVQNSAVEKFRINRAFYLSIFGLGLAAALVIALLIAGWDKASDITAVVGLFTSVLGTLVGAFFGLQIGSADKAKAEERADNAQKKADVLGAFAQPETIQRAMEKFPDLFK